MADKRVDPGGPIPAQTSGTTNGGSLYGGAPPPPPPSSHTHGIPSERQVFLKYVAAHPALKGMAGAIWAAANRFGGMTAVQIAAVILAESGGKKGATSNAGAYGLGQILDSTAAPANASGVPFFRPNHNISQADKDNPAFVANYIAWRIGGYMAANGVDLDTAWIESYNPGAKGDPKLAHYVSSFLPKGYVGIGGTTAAGAAGRSVDTSAVEQGLKNPWIVGVSKSGKLRVVNSPVAPKNAVMYDGTPMTVSDWDQLRRGLDQYFISYTGGRPDNKTLLQYVSKGWSPYSLTVALTKSKNFMKSPIWKSQAPAYQDAAKDIVPAGSKAPAALIRSAILNNWSTAAFQAVLRQSPNYVQSNEFRANTATLMNVHTSIMGQPDAASLNTVKQAALAGWSPDQYAAYLRSSPQYTSSPEYQTKALTFLSSLGLITGQQPVLKQGVAPDKNTNVNPSGPLPDDKRVPAGDLSRPEDTVATYG